MATARSIPFTGLARARGNDLAAQNDEPEPQTAAARDEAFFARVDNAVLQDKQGDGWNLRNDARALALQNGGRIYWGRRT